MNEIALLLIVTTTLSAWILFVVVMLTIADLRTIVLEKALRRHPHARKWRGVTKLRARLNFHDNESLIRQPAMRFALARFQAKPSTRFVEILPLMIFPQTTAQFFAAYRIFALAPFLKVRGLMSIRSSQQWPILTQPDIAKTRWERYYAVGVWLLGCIHVVLLAYICLIAMLGETSYLLFYIAGFGLWLAWSICNYPGIAPIQKVVYVLLMPVSFGYFLWRAIIAPFAPLRLLRLLVARRPVLS